MNRGRPRFLRSALLLVMTSHPLVFAGTARRIAPLVLLVFAFHAALLAVPVRSARPLVGAIEPAPLHVRMIGTARPETDAGPTPTPTPPLPSKPGEGLDQPSPAVALEAPTQQVTNKLADLPTAPASVSPPLPVLPLVLLGVDNDDDYFPRSMLTIAPASIDVVAIDYPAIPADSGHYISELTLFIDETGLVARVRVDGEGLPPALEAAARAAFMSARFRPGEVAGQAVKSRVRIEVEFDNRPTPRR